MRKLLSLFLAATILQVAHVQSAPDDLSRVKVLKGYANALAGEQLAYNCFNPIASTALLTRCTTGEMAIEWETEPVPANAQGDELRFQWIVSFSTATSGGDRKFDFFINGQKTFVIATERGPAPREWTLKAEDGSKLAFQLVKEDGARDANGYMFLTVPAGKYKTGEPLRLRVVGQKASSNDWFMTFMYDLREVEVDALSLPFLTMKEKSLRQTVGVAVTFMRDKGSAMISVDNGKTEKNDLIKGVNIVEIPVPAVNKPRGISVRVSVDGGTEQAFTVMLRPVAKRTIYLLPHSHNDIGYTDIQTNVLKKQVKNIYDALDLIKKTASYPPETRFKWNVEVAWGLETFLNEASEAKRAEFLDDVKQGSISVEGLYLNMLTGLMRPEEFYRLTGFTRSLIEKYGINVTSAMISDVPAMTWNMIPTLTEAGIKYFSAGPNGYYTGGDRTGFTNSEWADRPFYWVSPSGTEKLLYWMTGFGYGSFFANLSSANANRLGFMRSVSRYFEWLDQISYPYDMIQMRHTVNGDNGTVDPDLPKYAASWNEKYVSPKIVVSTTPALFSEFEKRYGNVLPVYSGDFTPYWEDGAASSAYELGLTRNASESLVQTEALSAMLNPAKYNDKKLYDAWKSVLLFNEHTWGAFNSTTEPDSPFVLKQWEIKKSFATTAAMMADELRSTVLAPAQGQKGESAFEVLNTNSWERTDLVILPKSESGAGDLVKDEKGAEVPSQRLSNGDLAFLASGVPPLGARRFAVHSGMPSFKSHLRIEGSSILDDNLEVVLDSQTGAIRHLKTLLPAIECVDTTKGSGLNEYLYVPGIDPKEATKNGKVTVTVKDRGPLVASVVITSAAPGCKKLTREVRVISGMERVDLINTIDKAMVRANEAVHFGFPFSMSDPVTRIDLGYGVFKPEADQLSGSCKDYFSAQRWVDVSNQQYGVTLTVLEAPLVEVGELHSELPSPHNVNWRKHQGSSAWIGSYVMNNYWYTNYKADQEGISSYHYSIQPHGLFNQTKAMRLGVERSQPLVVRQVTASTPTPAPLFTVTPANVSVTYVKPLGNTGYLVRLFNAGGAPETARLVFNGAKQTVYMSDPSEKRGEKVDEISMPANGIVTLRVERAASSNAQVK
jgi:alpha-mannosidase